MAGPLLSFSKPCMAVGGGAPHEGGPTFPVRPTIALHVSGVQANADLPKMRRQASRRRRFYIAESKRPISPNGEPFP